MQVKYTKNINKIQGSVINMSEVEKVYKNRMSIAQQNDGKRDDGK